MKLFMITFIGDDKRMKNFNLVKKLSGNRLELFKAINTVDHFDEHCKKGVKDGIISQACVKIYKDDKRWGGVGCCLSHIALFRQIKQADFYGEDWFLILEDDVGVKGGFIEQLETIDFGDSLFVRLLHNPGWDNRFAHQFDHTYRIKGDIYRMIPQWHTIA